MFGGFCTFSFCLQAFCAAFFDLSLAFSTALLAHSSDFRFRFSSLFRLLSSLSFFSCSFSCNISNAPVLVSKRARGSAFFGPQGVEAAGATKNLERALSFSLLELVAREGELVDKCVEVEAEEDAPPEGHQFRLRCRSARACSEGHVLSMSRAVA